MSLNLLLPFRDIELDQRVVEAANGTVSKFKTQTNFIEFVGLINKIILMADSDFVDAFANATQEELDRPINEVRVSKIQQEFSDVTMRIYGDNPCLKNFRVLISTEGSIGWDALRIRHIDTDLVGSESMKKIHHVSKFLMNVRKSERDLIEVFRFMKRETGILKEAHILRTMMLGFISRTLHYFYVDVMDQAWSRFLSHRIDSIKSLIMLYNSYVTTLYLTIQRLENPAFLKASVIINRFVQLVRSGKLSKPVILQDLGDFGHVIYS